MAILVYKSFEDTLQYVPARRNDCVIESVSAFLTVWWSRDGKIIEGVILRHCSCLVSRVRELFDSVKKDEKDFPWDNLPLPLLVRAALLGVCDRYACENRPRKEFECFSKKVSWFVLGVMIPCDMAKEMIV